MISQLYKKKLMNVMFMTYDFLMPAVIMVMNKLDLDHASRDY